MPLARPKEGQVIRIPLFLCDSIRRFFQAGGLIGFSVGHKYKRSAPYDRSAGKDSLSARFVD